MQPRRAAALVTALLLAFGGLPLSAPAALAAPTLPPLLELPPWALGFFWTYHYQGTYDLTFGIYTANSLNDSYTSSIVGENLTARGDAWIVRNTHVGTVTGSVSAIPSTGTITSETWYLIRKSDQALLNFTQDLYIDTTLPIIGPLNAHVHNETYADPPFAQVAFGHPADGSLWHVYSNLSSTGYIQFGATAPQNTTSYTVIDLNLSVTDTVTATVPAGTFDAYNISGSGTVDANGTVYNGSEWFLWSPKAQANVIDEAGYALQSLFVNRPPTLDFAIPPVHVPSPGYNDSLDLSAFVGDPEGDPITFSSCAAEAPLSCTLSPAGALNVSAPPGVNATLNVSFTVDDGLPSGAANFSLVALASGPGNANGAPFFAGSTVAMVEDTELTLDLLPLFTDPEGDPIVVLVTGSTNLYLVATNGSVVRLLPATDFNGPASLSITAYDTGGNDLSVAVPVNVMPVNDAPHLLAVSPPSATLHAGIGLVQLAVAWADVDGDTLVFRVTQDGLSSDWPTDSIDVVARANATGGWHNVTIVATDGNFWSNEVTFAMFVFEGPHITSASPANASLRVANNTSFLFSVNASDPDSPTLHYRWTLDGVGVADADNASSQRIAFSTPGTHRVRVVVSDNGTNDTHEWTVEAEEAPPGLVVVYSPVEGAELEMNATVALIAVLDPRLNATLEWRLDGAVISTSGNDTTPPLAPGNHSITLRVSGLYNQLVQYDDLYHFSLHVKAPPAGNGNGNNTGNNGNNGTNGNTTHPDPMSGLLLPLLLALAAAAAVAAFVVMRRRKAPPAAPPVEPPAA